MQLNCSSNEDNKEPVTIPLEEAKAFDKGRWQFKSNPNPWSKSEPPRWEFYSLEDNYLIEKAFYNKQKEVDFGDYLISLEHMIQKKKNAVVQQRPIRRVNWKGDVHERDRSMRYFETELPKTINKVFGSLGDFLGFFSRRNPEILDFTSQFENIEKLNDVKSLNMSIIPKVVRCLEELVKPILGQPEDLSLSAFQMKLLSKKKEDHRELIALFKKDFSSFEEFYGAVLRAYTMNTSLYDNLNRYLRNESWVEIDILLPYAFSLCKAFFNLKLHPTLEVVLPGTEPKGCESIILYRGTAFDENCLFFYKTFQIAQHRFSWNSVTSTSKSKKIALDFMYKAADPANKKYPVLFIIEIPIAKDKNELKYLEWIDMHHYSAMPKEDEAILAPGSVFELVEVSTDKDEKTTIRLKMANMIQPLAHAGLIMQGVMQSKMMVGSSARIVCLEGEELLDALKCLVGNKLIEQIEFCMCKFDNKLAEALIETLSTLERAKEFKLISCQYQNNGGLPSEKEKRLSISKAQIFGMSELYKIFTIHNEDGNIWAALNELQVEFGSQLNPKDVERDIQLLKGLQNLAQLTSLTLNFQCCIQITDERMHSLAFHALQNLTQVTFLDLSFSFCNKITDEGVWSLASGGLQNLTQLTSLSLNFEGCKNITNQGVWSLASQGLKHLIKLTSLSLNFRWCKNITDKGVWSLPSQGLKYLAQLTFLELNFWACDNITDEGAQSLISEEVKNLTQLTELVLSFSYCDHLKPQVMRMLRVHGFQYLTKLALDCRECKKITPNGVMKLRSEICRYLSQLEEFSPCNLGFVFSSSSSKSPQTQKRSQYDMRDRINLVRDANKQKSVVSEEKILSLTPENLDIYYHAKGRRKDKTAQIQNLENFKESESLALFFNGPKEITDEVMQKVASQEIQFLTQLTNLILSFIDCENITDELVHSLTSQGLRYLTQLRSLVLDFKIGKNMTDEAIQALPSKDVIEVLPQASNFKCCRDLTDKGVSSIASQGLQFLTQLTDLILSFSDCEKITDEGLQNLALEGLSRLTQLKSLVLNFNNCKNITDEGVSSLASQGLQNLAQLKFLTLDFQGCIKITSEGVLSLASQGLQNLVRLACLDLNFAMCDQITDKGVWSLASEGLRNLSQLTSLTLDFVGCQKITDQGILGLACKGFPSLSQLTFLTLDFQGCTKITDEGVWTLSSQGLKNLNQLTDLTLNFHGCCNLTDEGVYILVFEGLKHMRWLSYLSLHFQKCSRITDFMFSNLSHVLNYLGFE